MRVRMIGGVLGEDHTSWAPGSEHEASDAFGQWLVTRGKALALTEPPPDPGIIDTTALEQVMNPDPKASSRDPRARRR